MHVVWEPILIVTKKFVSNQQGRGQSYNPYKYNYGLQNKVYLSLILT